MKTETLGLLLSRLLEATGPFFGLPWMLKVNFKLPLLTLHFECKILSGADKVLFTSKLEPTG